MKISLLLLPLLISTSLSSCTSTVTQSPVYNAPVPSPTATTVTTSKTRRAPVQQQAVTPIPGAMRQVPSTFPQIPLKEETGITPLIHNAPDTPTYKRSNARN